MLKPISYNNIDSLMSDGSNKANQRDMVVLDMRKYVVWLSNGLGYTGPDKFEARNEHCKV